MLMQRDAPPGVLGPTLHGLPVGFPKWENKDGGGTCLRLRPSYTCSPSTPKEYQNTGIDEYPVPELERDVPDVATYPRLREREM